MKKSTLKANEQKTDQLCFQKNGILYVPHLKLRDMFAYPGMPSKSVGISKYELEKMGATPIMKRLYIGL